MTDIPRGPVCASQLGPDFIDPGTLARNRSSPTQPTGTDCLANRDVPYPQEVAKFASWLIREGYIQRVTLILPQGWAGMSETQLTAYLRSRYTQQDLEQMFLMKYEERAGVKMTFRNLNIIAALLIGLIWARENVKNGEWGTALAKIGGAGAAAVVLNKVLYARDASAAEIMANNAENFGKWFQGAARSSGRVNLFLRLNIITTIAQLSLSGGGEYPQIPFDIIYDIDVNDPQTWRPPSQTLLSLGFNIWYRQKDTNIFLGNVEGSLIKTILENTILSKPAY